jgi:signal transduction histidine kinase
VDFQQVSGVRLAPEVERAMIGIVREALHNVRKHANADSVRLEVRRINDSVEIAVTDDGVGIQGSAPAGHFGLEQIRELAEETGGRLEVGSRSGEGTSVKAWIPLVASAQGDG